VGCGLAETEAGIDDDALANDAARLGRGDALGEIRADSATTSP